jgi:hypothetical protein
MPAPQLTRLGPWPGGLNLRDADVGSDVIPPSQVRELTNLDVTPAGVLVPRRGCRRTAPTGMYTTLGGSGLFSLLGSVDDGGTRYAVVGAHNGSTPGTTTFHYTSAAHSTFSGDWPNTATTASQTGKFSTVVQYGGRIYFVHRPSGGGAGYYRTSLSSGGFTSVAAMPAGEEAFVIRDRLFVVDRAASRIYYSKATDPLVWAAPDGGSFDVNPGDGQNVLATAVVNSQLYVFKRNRTYLFTFTADPALDGQLTLINDQLGAFGTVVHENGVVVANDQGVFRLLNNYFSRVDDAVLAPDVLGLADSASDALAVVIEGDQLVIGPTRLSSPVYTHLAMNLRTRAWSGRSYSDTAAAPNTRQIVSRSAAAGTTVLYGDQSRTLAAVRTYPGRQLLDLTSASAVVSPAYSVALGEYDFGSFFEMKGLAWAAVRLEAALPAGDAEISLRTWEGTGDLTLQAQSVAVPVGGEGKKVALARRRFQSITFGLRKPQTTLSPTITDPETPSALWIRGIEARVNPSGGSARQ